MQHCFVLYYEKCLFNHLVIRKIANYTFKCMCWYFGYYKNSIGNFFINTKSTSSANISDKRKKMNILVTEV